MAEADSLLLVVDGQEGLTGSDQEIVSWLRRKHPGKPITLAVNKCENVKLADTMVGFLRSRLQGVQICYISTRRDTTSMSEICLIQSDL